jgi:hypothetical protein
VGDCFFDVISCLLKYLVTSLTIRQNCMVYLQECIVLGTPKASNCCKLELNVEFFHDLHHEQVMNEQNYIKKMSILITNCGLWGDFTTLFWISKYLQCPIHVWGRNSGQITSKVGNEYNSEFYI